MNPALIPLKNLVLYKSNLLRALQSAVLSHIRLSPKMHKLPHQSSPLSSIGKKRSPFLPNHWYSHIPFLFYFPSLLHQARRNPYLQSLPYHCSHKQHHLFPPHTQSRSVKMCTPPVSATPSLLLPA